MLQLTPETEQLARRIADRLGRKPDDLIRAALEHEVRAGVILPWRRPTREPSVATKEEFFARLDEIALRSANRPVVDPRSADEIIGYDDFGLPR